MIQHMRAWIASASLAAALLALPAPALALNDFTWSGASMNSRNWSDGANWIGGVAPSGSVGTLELPTLPNPPCDGSFAGPACYSTVQDIAGIEANAVAIGPAEHTQENRYFVDDSDLYDPRPAPGDPISIGAGGLTVTGGANLNLPIALAADQTWSVHDQAVNNGVLCNFLLLDSPVTGSQALNVTLDGCSSLQFNGGANVGPITISGSSPFGGDLLVGPQQTGLSGVGDVNGTDGEPLTIDDTALFASSGIVGPLTVNHGDLFIDGGPRTGATGVTGCGAGGLQVAGGVTLSPGNTADPTWVKICISHTDSSDTSAQLSATGTVSLNGAQLTLVADPAEDELTRCSLPVGHVYTLVATTESVQGTFAGLPGGATTTVEGCASKSPALRIDYAPKKVTATVVAPGTAGGGTSQPPLTVAPPVAQPPLTVTIADGGGGGVAGAQDRWPYGKPLCQPGADLNVLHLFAVTFRCLFSGQAFFDPDLKAKDRCLASLGTDALTALVPATKLARIAAYSSRFGTPAQILADSLRRLSPAGIDSKVLEGLDHADSILRAMTSRKTAAEEFFAFVFTSHRALGAITKKAPSLAGKVRATQDGLSALFKAVTGVDDIEKCVAAYG